MNNLDKRRFAASHGVSDEEYERVLEVLGREPSMTEIGVVSAMWSEHCSYKSSRVHLKKFPTTGPQVVQGPGENAGAVDIGGGLAAVFKMESHNHPSYIEPYQGAATGVGGILRDVFTMGARPIASLNSLRFGAIDHARTPYLFHGVVGGIAGYGNCVGVPTVGGEIYFDASYNGNILVNVFTVGVCKKDEIFLGVARGVGNPVFYVGAGTGRDGIHGATMASAQFSDQTEEKRPTVQVGDPFREKLLLEACLELMKTDVIVGIQDMGAAGLTSSSVEMADRGKLGIRIDADKIPVREENMSAYEMLLSESQERMLIVVERGKEDAIARIFDKWELEWAQIGEVIAEQRFEVYEKGELACDLPVSLLTSAAPQYDRPRKRPAYLDALKPAVIDAPDDLGQAFVELMASPNICSRASVYKQFDHMVGIGTVVRPGMGDAAVVRIPGTEQALAITVDCNSRFCYLDPREGAKLAVAECARNISCVGATPLGITDCLNFGDPTHPEVMWQFSEAVEGMSEACIAFDTPVVSGNVSLYNASFDKDIYPTPTVAMVGNFSRLLEGPGRAQGYCDASFKGEGDRVVLFGRTDTNDIGGSEYLWTRAAQLGQRPPRLDLELEKAVQRLVRDSIAQGLLLSAHDCADGGLGVTLAECCIGAEGHALGLNIEMDIDTIARADLFLFCESPSRIVVSVREADLSALVSQAEAAGVPSTVIGTVTALPRLVWPGVLDLPTGDLQHAHKHGLSRLDA
ncbi:MAG: phosphoribosylformylglycinamidine synthase subunit PurL [Bradymonadaceae bacterium]|nr:phosphoribosylformylglycinamidine synthase subunit PurL [Lujinxingiaceae bacterium]